MSAVQSCEKGTAYSHAGAIVWLTVVKSSTSGAIERTCEVPGRERRVVQHRIEVDDYLVSSHVESNVENTAACG